MTGFRVKTIVQALKLGESLKEVREKKNLDLAAAAARLNIPAKYLAALENGEYQKLPGDIYAKSFLKSYAQWLGLDAKDCLGLYANEQKVYSQSQKEPISDFKKPVRRVSRLHLAVTPKIIRSAFVALLALACLVYLGVKIRGIMSPPALSVEAPAENLVSRQNYVKVSGRVEKEAVLQINGQPALIDENGRFNESLDLQPGVNLIEVMAETRHGRQTKIYRHVILKEEVN